MYFTTNKLLKYVPKDALLILFNQSTGLKLHPDYVRIKDIESLGGTDTRVLLEGYTPENPLVSQLYSGEAWFTYDRIDVESVFFDLQHVVTPLPTTTHDILDAIRTQAGIEIDLTDVPLQAVTESPWTFTPANESLRWIGSVRLVVGPKLVCDDLSGALLSFVLNDFEYPPTKDRIKDYLLVNVLDDFKMPSCDCPDISEGLLVNVLDSHEYPEYVCIVYPIDEHLVNNVLDDYKYPTVLTYRLDYIVPERELNGFIPVGGDLSDLITETELDGFEPVT